MAIPLAGALMPLLAKADTAKALPWVLRGAGALGGAKIGAAIGTAILPGVGTVIGGIGGSIIGGLAGGRLADIFSGADRRRKFEEQRVILSTQKTLFSSALDDFDRVLDKLEKTSPF